MKLLSLKLTLHDSNISYFDGKNVHYYKSERDFNIKHHGINNVWEWKNIIKRIWNLDENDIDEMVVMFEPNAINFPNYNHNDIFPAMPYDLFPTKCPVWLMNHHYAHALSCHLMTDIEPDVYIVVDGMEGEYHEHTDPASFSVFSKEHKLIKRITAKTISLGSILNHFGAYVNLKGHHDDLAGKIMSLQSYGNIDNDMLNYFRQYNLTNFIKNVFLNSFPYMHDSHLLELFYLDFIKTTHLRLGEMLLDFFNLYAKPNDIIFYSGGVAQNIVWNTVLKKHFPNLIIPPHCNDEGLSLGGLEWLRRKNNLPKFKLDNFPYCQHDVSVEEPSIDTIKKTAKLLSEGNIIAWYQGHGELGPRALGNRSILMDPRIENGKDKINSVKQRENFRPFGASVLENHKHKYFDISYESPYMLYTCLVKDPELKSITHIDGTSRIQTVNNENNIFKLLLEEFYKITGCAVLLNTSLNINGRPISNSPNEALELFNNSSIDYLIIGNKIYSKNGTN